VICADVGEASDIGLYLPRRLSYTDAGCQAIFVGGTRVTFCLLPAFLICFVATVDLDDKTAASEPLETAHSRCFSFDGTGNRLVGVTQRGDLLFWKAKDAAKPIVIKLEQQPVLTPFNVSPSGVALDREGKHAALFYHDGRAQVWDLQAGGKVKDLTCDQKRLSYACRSPDGKLIACLSYPEEPYGPSRVLLWNTNDWSPAGQLETLQRGYYVHDYCFSADGGRVFACVGYPTDLKNRGFTGIVAFDLKSKKEIERLEYGEGFPVKIAVSPDGRWVATGGGDAVPTGGDGRNLSGHLRIFDWKAKKLAAEPYMVGSDYVRCVAFSPDGKRLYSTAETLPPSGNQYTGELRAFVVGDWRHDWTAALASTPHEMAVSTDGLSILIPDRYGLKVFDSRAGKLMGEKLRFRFTDEDKAFFHKLLGRDK